MSRITDPRGRVMPVVPKAQQAGNPHTSAGELSLSERVITTWYESVRQARCYPFANPDVAPGVTIAASFTDYTFAFQDGTWDDTAYFPWCMQVDSDTIRLLVTVATDVPIAGLVIWAESQTLSAGVTTVVGPMVSVPPGLSTQPPPGPWLDPEHQFELGNAELQIRDPDLTPGKGEVALVIKAQWRPTVAPVAGVSVSYDVRLFSVNAWNDIRDLRDT